MRKIIRASLLVLALSCPVYAGYIPNNITDAPPASSTTEETADGHIPNNQPTESTVTDAVLSLLQSVLSLL